MNQRDALIARRLVNWYRRHRRDLPWRVPLGSAPSARPHPYHVLVSELMLQQTQVSTVIPYFLRFIRKFPTIRHLANSSEPQVLRLWQGLGYYSRARNLRAAAIVVERDFAGEIPDDLPSLLRLPGVGRYTAGAIASLAFNRRVPIVDGNVARVICRLDQIESDPREIAAIKLLWDRAAKLIPRNDVSDFNSAMMELGATVCKPRQTHCRVCPLRDPCLAFAAGVQDRIPRRTATNQTPLLRRRVLCIRRCDSGRIRWLIEQRPTTGRWAGMWQFVTREHSDRTAPIDTSRPIKLGTIRHQLTHRRYRFDIYTCDACSGPTGKNGSMRWVTLAQLYRYPLSLPHVKIVQLLSSRSSDSQRLPRRSTYRISNRDRSVI